MKQISLTYSRSAGWSGRLPSAMDSPDTLVMIFAAPAFGQDTAALVEIGAALPNSMLLGCSGAGEIAGTSIGDATLSVAIVRFEHTRLRRFVTGIANVADSARAGAEVARALADPALRFVFLLSDGLCVNGTQLVNSLTENLPRGVAISGGLAGDATAFQHTWVLDGTRPMAGRVSAIGFYGDRLRVGQGCEGGWTGFGPARRITRSEGSVLFELDDKPALELYKKYLGERAAELPASALLFPLAVQTDDADPTPRVRTILGIDEARQSMTFAGDIPQGGLARLMRANADKLIGSATQAARRALDSLEGADAQLLISVSCVGRRLVLGERTEEEVEAVAELAPPGAGHVGFYSYGEIAPAAFGLPSALHNQTMTVTALGEA